MMHGLLLAVAMQRWLLVSDVHLDPFFQERTVFGAGDTTPVLWRMSLDAMRRDIPNPDVVVVGGDLMAHVWRGLAHDAKRDPTESAVATTRAIANDLGSLYPQARFLVTLGNNDDPCGDYRAETGGPYMRAITAIWAPLVERYRAAPDFVQQFGRGGYYTAALPGGERAIIMNSVFWSFVNRPGCESTTSRAAVDEEAWLNATLAAIPSGTRAVTLMHIPPGYDPQTTATLARDLVAVPFLSGSANAKVLAAFASYQTKIAFAIGAHTHRYDVRDVSGVPMIIGSSISPVYGNSPAFYELDIDGHGNLHDVIPFVYDPYRDAFEREPSFDTYYGVAAPTVAAIEALTRRVEDDAVARKKWLLAREAWAYVPRNRWKPFACAQTELDGGFAACAGVRIGSVRAAITDTLIALPLAVIAIAVASVLWLRRR